MVIGVSLASEAFLFFFTRFASRLICNLDIKRVISALTAIFRATGSEMVKGHLAGSIHPASIAARGGMKGGSTGSYSGIACP